MSRSYKKTPGICDRNPFMKNYSNRIIRRKPISYEIANGGAYRKIMCSYDICDYKFLYHGGDHAIRQEISNHLLFLSNEDADKEYYRCKTK